MQLHSRSARSPPDLICHGVCPRLRAVLEASDCRPGACPNSHFRFGTASCRNSLDNICSITECPVSCWGPDRPMHLSVASKNDGHCISSFQSSYVPPVRVSDVVIWSNRVPPRGLLLASNLFTKRVCPLCGPDSRRLDTKPVESALPRRSLRYHHRRLAWKATRPASTQILRLALARPR